MSHCKGGAVGVHKDVNITATPTIVNARPK